MPDAMDAIQERALREQEEIVAHRPQVARAGRTHCIRVNCREPIAPQRTVLGAQLCMDCQHEQDARDAHVRSWSRR